MSEIIGPKLVVLVVILAMLGTGVYIAHLTQQTSEANGAVPAGCYADRVSEAIRDTEVSMGGQTQRR